MTLDLNVIHKALLQGAPVSSVNGDASVYRVYFEAKQIASSTLKKDDLVSELLHRLQQCASDHQLLVTNTRLLLGEQVEPLEIDDLNVKDEFEQMLRVEHIALTKTQAKLVLGLKKVPTSLETLRYLRTISISGDHFANDNVCLYMGGPQGSCEKLLASGVQLLGQATFPSASQGNSASLEEFCIVVSNFTESICGKPEWEKFIIEAMAKTYQSVAVTKLAMMFYGDSNRPKECVLNFVNLRSYHGADVHSYNYIVSKRPRSIDGIFDINKCVDEFEALLDGTNPPNYWLTLYHARYSLSNLEMCQKYAENSLACYNSEAALEYAQLLLTTRQVAKCMEFVKNTVLEHDVNNWSAWYIYVQCLSIAKEHLEDTCLPVVSGVLESIDQCEPDLWMKIKMFETQVVAQIAPQEAVAMLPEVFQLYNFIYNDKSQLSKVWLFAGQLYRIVGENDEVRKAAEEATGLEASLLRGYAYDRLADFESVLQAEPNNLEALCGWAELLLKTGKADAIARAKIALENSIKTVPGYYSTNVWWALSRVYEFFNDHRYEDALWRCVQLQETQVV